MQIVIIISLEEQLHLGFDCAYLNLFESVFACSGGRGAQKGRDREAKWGPQLPHEAAWHEGLELKFQLYHPPGTQRFGNL